METICFLRDLDISIKNIAEILESDESKKVIELLLDEQEKNIQKDVKRKTEQLEKIESIRSALSSFKDESQKTIHDISQLMEEKDKLKKMYKKMVIIAISLGEEVGWRGAMYLYLKEKFGVTKGRIVGGTIWGAWHWPIMIFAGYEYGKEYIGAPVLRPIVFCISTVMMGILFDYVYEKTETIWLPSLMHGAVNAFTIFAYLSKPEYADMAIFGPAYIGIISMIPMIIMATIICVKQKKIEH